MIQDYLQLSLPYYSFNYLRQAGYVFQHDVYETWWKDVAWATEEAITFWSRSESQGRFIIFHFH